MSLAELTINLGVEQEGKETQVEDDQDTEVYEDDDGDDASDDEVAILPAHQISPTHCGKVPLKTGNSKPLALSRRANQ